MESCSDGEQSALLNGNPTQLAYLPPDKMTDFSRLSRFGMTFKPLMESRGEELLTLYLAGFPAKTLAQQEKAQELTESDQECGDTWRGWLAKYDQDSCSWRTAQCSFLEDLNECLETLPRSGMTRNGLLWELPMLEQTIRETEFGLSPDGETTFHTPNCSGLDGGSNSRKALKKKQMEWTPKRKSGQPAQYTINQAVRDKMYPTPTCHNAKECASPSEYNRNTPTLATHAGGKLNPDWVEWLMNWPIKWSDLNGFDKQEFQRWQEASATAVQRFREVRTMWWDSDPSQASHGQQSIEQSEKQHCNSLPEMSRDITRQREMEGSHERSNLPLLRDNIHISKGQGENLQSGVREQTCMDETQIVPRVGGTGVAVVDRLKAIGNGQVPLCAATAWKLLNA